MDYLSLEKRKLLEQELEELRTKKRKEILDALEYAKSLGDLSENAEYHQAREDQAKLEDRINYLVELLKSSMTIKKTSGEEVGLGSKVVVRRDGGEEREFTIVGQEESDSAAGKISHQSPIGLALLGRKSGQEIKVETPKGSVSYTITKVS